METELLPKLSGKKQALWHKLLLETGLTPDDNAEVFLLIWDGDDLIATGARKGNLLKCIAVSPDRQGEDLTATVLTQLRQDAFSAGHSHLFLYTKPGNVQLFSSVFFYPIAQTADVALLESKPQGIREFLKTLPAPCKEGVIGSAVMNCNPFTLGHQHLIRTAAAECDWVYVFVLSEDRSDFSFKDRLAMVQAGTADLKNVSVLPTGPYLISSATFPTYFLKNQAVIEKAQCKLDAKIFAKHYAPAFSITRRYVGTEPLCAVTEAYNQVLSELLPKQGIALQEIDRLEQNGTPVSATIVRKLLREGNFEALRAFVPQSTFDYLKDKF